MPKAILIAFEYTHTHSCLSGAIIDLYEAYTWCMSWNCSVHILTDIHHRPNSQIIQDALSAGIVGNDIRNFSNVPKNIVRSRTDVIDCIGEILNSTPLSDDQLVIYYTGHGIKDSIVLPDGGHLSFVHFKNSILHNIRPSVHIFWILDCCNPNGLRLPYILNNNSFTLAQSSSVQFSVNPILLITSARTNEKSVSTKLGSVFSHNLFKILTTFNKPFTLKIEEGTPIIPTSRNRNLRRLTGTLSSAIRKMATGYTQTVSIYSSYIMDPILWLWIGSSKSYNVNMDPSLSIFMIQARDHQHAAKTIHSSSEQDTECEPYNPYDLIYPE